MPFITNYNNYKLKNIFLADDVKLDGKIYKSRIDIFNEIETKRLLFYQLLLLNPESALNLLETKNELLSSLNSVGSYHYYQECKSLNSPYTPPKNVSSELQDLVTNEDETKPNSGVVEFAISKESLEKKIEKLILDIDDKLKHDSLIQQYCQKTYLLKSNNTNKFNLSKDEIKSLSDFNYNYKLPLFDSLMNYYSISNKESFNSRLLEKMGFRLCKTCFELDTMFKEEDVLVSGKYKGEKCGYVYTFHPEYIDDYIIKSSSFCIDIKQFEKLHTHSLQNLCRLDLEDKNLIEILDYDEELDAMGTIEHTLKEYLLKYKDIYDVHYLNPPSEKKLYKFSDLAIAKNNEKIEKLTNRKNQKSI